VLFVLGRTFVRRTTYNVMTILFPCFCRFTQKEKDGGTIARAIDIRGRAAADVFEMASDRDEICRLELVRARHR